jgi:DNA polymerase-3 subunit delta'
LQNITEQEIQEALIEKKQVPSEKAIGIASYVNGSYSQALEQIDNNKDNNLHFNLFVDWMRLCFKKDIAGAISFSNTIHALGKEKQKTFLLFTLSVFQKSLTGNFTGIENIKISPSYKDFIQKFMPFVHSRNMEELHQQMSDAHYHIERNANAKILFLDLSFILFRLIKK